MEVELIRVAFEVGKKGVIRIEALAEGIVVQGASGRRLVIPPDLGEKPKGGHAPAKAKAASPAKKKPASPKKAPAKPAPKKA